MPRANDNNTAPSDAIPFSDLALAMGVDEETLLQRFAEILRKRGRNSAAEVAEG